MANTTITPSHEHFLSRHIRQKVLIHIERIQSANPKPDTKTFVLFLPLMKFTILDYYL